MHTKILPNVFALTLCSMGAYAEEASQHGFIEDSHATLSSRTMYYGNDNHEGGADQREVATALKFDYLSGFTQGTVGFGIDVSSLVAVHLDGGKGHHPDSNTFFPSDSDGSAEHSWGRVGANLKTRFSKTELRVGNAFNPSLPILVATDSRLVYQNFGGGILTSKEIDSLTINVGKLDQSSGRATSNPTGLAVAGGTKASNDFRFAGGDWKATKDLTLQYYYANLENYYTQNFVGLVHVLPLGNDQSFKTDLRYFDSRADGKNGEAGYRFNNNNGFAKDPGEVNNKTWSAMFTYSLGEHAFLLGRQEVNDDGGFVWLNQANVTDDRKRPEGNGGTAFYLFTDAMIGNFARAGAKTNFGQYAYSFAKLGIPGLKASVSYMNGNGIKDIKGGSDHSEWERDARVDYVIPNGPLKGFGTTLRHGTYRGDNSAIADQDQTRLIFNYSYSFL
ncbi:OprD family porin [Pseudomonas sp. TNT2022 ID1044]|mgnify:CR=1 FL=1|uniref:OprD family outer membrane porin n=1 Tax=Pseudomonas sp. TNT2022 ID1044 TaxID=2942636 RepID=UPI00235F064B|nr:OprD family outer membrane porin [Pseudomonas sp. TNT2022 ID1044]MDD0998379.1 OprD family porin [Pseudomonas sp. TNT2022 ID1044]